MREVMRAISDPDVDEVWAVMASQVSKSESLVWNPVGYVIDHDPGPILIVEPREADATHNSKTRLAPMIRETPRLAQKITPSKSRDSSNTLLEKHFSAGFVRLAGANVPSGLAGDPIRWLFLNEVSRFPKTAGAEGDPVGIARKRQQTFPDAKLLANSSPTDEGDCRITAGFEDTDQRYYHVPCPMCGFEQRLVWTRKDEKDRPVTGPGGVKWEHDEEGNPLPETAKYQCESCAELWSEGQRHHAVSRGRWIATKPFTGKAGFHLNGLYAPWARMSLPSLVQEWYDVKDSPRRLKVFVNTVLAEVWKQKTKRSDIETNDRCEVYPQRDGRLLVPRGVAVLTAGVDTQDDRLELQISGAGLKEERWKLQYHVIDGDPSGRGVWDDLWRILCTPIQFGHGGWDYIRSTCIDTGGHHTLAAYNFVRPRQRVRTPDGRMAYVFAIKGNAGAGTVWPREPSRNNKGKIPLYSLRVDPLKEALYTQLQEVVEPGPGFLHFPLPPEGERPRTTTERDFDDRYFDQLQAEKLVSPFDARGFEKREWQMVSENARNEALDTHNYGEAAVDGLVTMGLDLEAEFSRQEALWEAWEERDPDEDDPDPTPSPPVAPRARPPARRVVVKSRWLRGDR
jgi:phage terminase large subunit GpA-like protein